LSDLESVDKVKKFLIVAIVLVWICGTFIMLQGYIDRALITALICCISFSLLGVTWRLEPSKKELQRTRNLRRVKNKTQISDEEYIRQRKKTAIWYLAIGCVWGIYVIIMLIIRLI